MPSSQGNPTLFKERLNISHSTSISLARLHGASVRWWNRCQFAWTLCPSRTLDESRSQAPCPMQGNAERGHKCRITHNAGKWSSGGPNIGLTDALPQSVWWP